MAKYISKKQRVCVKLEIVKYTQLHGIRKASRDFGCSRNSVRTWLKGFLAKGRKGLEDGRMGPKFIPHKMNKNLEGQIIEARGQTPCYGPKRLKLYHELPVSEKAIARVLKQNNLIRKRRKKYEKKNDLRAVKAQYKALTRWQMDVKHLYDIAYFWPQMQRIKLPRYEYTLRDVKSGSTFLGFGRELSEAHAEKFISLFLEHLKEKGIELAEVIIQTDNGAEFSGGNTKKLKEGFVKTVLEKYRARHKYIPPGHCNANADVESFHATVELEFFDLEKFVTEEEFYGKAQVFQDYYNLTRVNFSKKGRTPYQIVYEDWKDINVADGVASFPVLNLDKKLYNQVGQSLPTFPENYFIIVESIQSE
jgi:transposase InsO family protein